MGSTIEGAFLVEVEGEAVFAVGVAAGEHSGLAWSASRAEGTSAGRAVECYHVLLSKPPLRAKNSHMYVSISKKHTIFNYFLLIYKFNQLLSAFAAICSK